MRLPTDTLSNDQGLPYGFLEIDPPGATNLGTINWTLQTSTGIFSGTTLGPATPVATPEPPTLALIGLGIASLMILRLFILQSHGFSEARFLRN
jgi:PEP-CTERM motif